MPPRQRVLRHATVTATERVSPCLVRLTFASPDLAGADLPFTDHYIKILFPPAEAPYSAPFDPEVVRERFPEHAPVTRTYSLRTHDAESGTITVDFVEHGDDGLAGPWAARAKVGDEIGFFGPGGAWAPDAEHTSYVLAGDEAAAPAISAALESLPAGARAIAFLEVADDDSRFAVPVGEGVEVVWVARAGAPYGSRLAETVRAQAPTDKGVAWFVHGVAEMVKDLRRYLFVELGLDRANVSISGYWRTGMTEDGWQSSKREFVAGMEEQEAAALAGNLSA